VVPGSSAIGGTVYFFFRPGATGADPGFVPDFAVLPPVLALSGSVSHDDDPVNVLFDPTSPIESAPSAVSRDSSFCKLASVSPGPVLFFALSFFLLVIDSLQLG